MDNIEMYRNRYIPMESVLLENDKIIYMDDEIIITVWETLKPRKDFDNGRSIYFLKEGYKISEFLNGDKKLYTYCDIINVQKENNKYIFTDLLADVVIYENGMVKVLDIGEISECLEKNIITKDIAIESLKKLDVLLEKIYNNELSELLSFFERSKIC